VPTHLHYHGNHFTLWWQEDEARNLQSFLMLRPKNQFQAQMEDTQFPRKFPIDNEDAIEM